mmetsp:Transcript_27781/g.79961  ORF Transcript_27781/g.79961 Transcript_27781/m.79961 type:complete len:276 (-) Transcript_27781:1802-2629(-)
MLVLVLVLVGAPSRWRLSRSAMPPPADAHLPRRPCQRESMRRDVWIPRLRPHTPPARRPLWCSTPIAHSSCASPGGPGCAHCSAPAVDVLPPPPPAVTCAVCGTQRQPQDRYSICGAPCRRGAGAVAAQRDKRHDEHCQLALPPPIHPAVAGRHATHTHADGAATAAPAAHDSHSHGRVSSVFERQRPPVPTRRRIPRARRVSPGEPHHAPSSAAGDDAVVLPFAHALTTGGHSTSVWPLCCSPRQCGAHLLHLRPAPRATTEHPGVCKPLQLRD